MESIIKCTIRPYDNECVEMNLYASNGYWSGSAKFHVEKQYLQDFAYTLSEYIGIEHVSPALEAGFKEERSSYYMEMKIANIENDRQSRISFDFLNNDRFRNGTSASFDIVCSSHSVNELGRELLFTIKKMGSFIWYPQPG